VQKRTNQSRWRGGANSRGPEEPYTLAREGPKGTDGGHAGHKKKTVQRWACGGDAALYHVTLATGHRAFNAIFGKVGRVSYADVVD